MTRTTALALMIYILITANYSTVAANPFGEACNFSNNTSTNVETALPIAGVPTKSTTILTNPVANLNPSVVNATLACGNSTTIDLILGNSGVSDLTYSSAFIGESVLDSSIIVFSDAMNFTNHTFEEMPTSVDTLFLEVTLNGDFGASTERAELYIEGTFIDIMEGGPTNGIDYTFPFVFTETQAADWLADGVLEVSVQNSDAVDDDQGGDNTHKVKIQTNGSFWSDASPADGVVTPGSTEIITVSLNSLGLVSGFYNNTLVISTNDPNNLVLNVPVNLEVTGDAMIEFDVTCVEFPEIMQYTSDALTVEITNNGCDTLMISDIQASNAVYSVAGTQYNILPFQSETLTVLFDPTTIGNFSSDLTFTSNIGTTILCLDGDALGAPLATVTPDSISVSVACGDSTTVDIQLSNVGVNDLTFEADFGGTAFVDSSLIEFDEAMNFTNHVFNGLSTGSDTIFIEVTLNGDFGATTEQASLFIEGTFIEVMEGGPTNGVDYTFPFVLTGPDVAMWLADGTLEVFVENTTAVNDDQGGDNTHKVKITTSGSFWSTVSPTDGTLAPNGIQTLTVSLNSLGLISGLYNNDLTIETNDPLNPVITIPMNMEVVGDATIEFGSACVDFPEIMQHTTDTLILEITNSGCDTLMITDIVPGNAAYTLNNVQFDILPFQTDTLTVYFNPATVGNFLSDLTFTTNIGPTTLCLDGDAFGAPVVSISPTMIDVVLACGDSTTVDLLLSNLGLSDMDFQAILGGAGIMETSTLIFDESENFTNHIFENVAPGTDSIYIDVTINGDFDDFTEFVDVIIEGTNVGAAEGGNFNGSDFTTSFAFGEAEIANWVSDGILDILLQNTQNVNDDQGGDNSHRIDIRTVGSFWSSVSPENGLISAGGNEMLTVSINSLGLATGNYTNEMQVTTNDPLNPVTNVPINLEVIGDADISFTVACLDFPPTMQYTTSTLALTIENSGCAPLVISDIFADDNAYSVDATQLTIPPFATGTVNVNFSSPTIGDFPSNLNIVSNIPTAVLCLSGSVFGAPSISTSPSNIDIALGACSDMITIPITVNNTAFDSLYYTFEGGSIGSSELNDVRERLNLDFETLTDVIPNQFLFSDGITGTNINDGGQDMYDGGNYLSVNNNFNSIVYSDNLITANPDLGTGGQYFTRKYPGLFIFAADINGVTNFSIEGNLGQDGNGTANGVELQTNHAGSNYSGFVKRVYDDPFTPAVTHLIIVKSDPNLSHNWTTNTNDDQHDLNGLSGSDRIYYLLFAESSGAEYTDNELQVIMETFLDIAESNNFTLLPDGNFELAGGASETFDVVFSTDNTEAGIYNIFVTLLSNDPLFPVLELPVTVTVNDDLCADFSYVQPIICGGQINFSSNIVNTPGTYLWDFGDGNTSTEPNPTHIYTQAGTFNVTLTVSNNTSTDQVSYVVDINEVQAPIEACLVTNPFNTFPTHDVSNVELNTIANQTGSSATTDYSDFTCDWSTTLTIGVPYPILVEGYSFSSEHVRVWIDLNNNGTFENNEIMFEEEDTDSPHSGTIVVPQGSTLGVPLRMRVACEDDFWNLPNGCGELENGEFEDYTVIIESNTAPPIANVSQSILDECQGVIQFTDQSTNLPTSWFWDFGDGNTSSFQNPIHTYDNAGVYVVTLTATNDFGMNTVSTSITVNALSPEIDFVGSPQINSNLSFLPNAPGAISWSWTFGDGGQANTEFPMHSYTTPGVYLVTLTATNGSGCSSTVTSQITILLTGVAELEQYISIYPNPSSGAIYIKNTGGERYNKIQVINALGQVLETIPTQGQSGDNYMLSLEDLSSGVYVLALHFDEDNVLRKKIVLEVGE